MVVPMGALSGGWVRIRVFRKQFTLPAPAAQRALAQDIAAMIAVILQGFIFRALVELLFHDSSPIWVGAGEQPGGLVFEFRILIFVVAIDLIL